MLPDTVYIIESDNFILNTFQAFLFTYFKQKRQFLYHNRLFKLSQGVNKLIIITECFGKNISTKMQLQYFKTIAQTFTVLSIVIAKRVLKVDSCIDIAALV